MWVEERKQDKRRGCLRDRQRLDQGRLYNLWKECFLNKVGNYWRV